MNVVTLIREQVKKKPYHKAVIYPQAKDELGQVLYSHYTFKQLDEKSDHLVKRFTNIGIKNGQKVLIFIRPSLDFPLVTFSLFKLGAIPVFIDPGIGLRNLLKAISKVKPQAMITVPIVYFLSRFFPFTFKTVETIVTTSRINFFFTSSLVTLKQTLPHEGTKLLLAEPNPDDPCAIVFTSGATGKPKGVLYTHRNFLKQIALIKKIFDLQETDIDMPAYPLFSLLSMAMGMTSIIADMDPTKPALADPEKLVTSIKDQGITLATGSPAVWENVANYCLENNIKLSSIKYLLMFGAPVPIHLHEKFRLILSEGKTYTPYGATEALPISVITGETILQETASLTEHGQGICVGQIAPDTEIKIIKPTDTPILEIKQVEERKKGEIGEILVKGEQVTREYWQKPQDTKKAKIIDKDSFWHRMGDLGYIDEKNRLWFCGRKVHQIKLANQTLYSVNCEALFNVHPEVKRSALISVTQKKKIIPAIVIERKDQRVELSPTEAHKFKEELLLCGKNAEHTKDIQLFFLHPHFPVDRRHNIKIDRKQLARYFANKLYRCL